MLAGDGNPYSYAGNNPLNTTDPTGLRPLTDGELKAYDGSSGGALAAAGNWLGDNWEYLVAGAAVLGGVALMCTGVGGPAGLALMMGAGALVSGGISAATQKAGNGSVDWYQVGVDTVLGALAGGLGGGTGAIIAARSGSGLAARAATAASGGAVEGGASGAASYAMSPGPHTPGGFIQTTGTGAAVGGATGGITGYKPKWLGIADMKTFKYGLYSSGYSHGETILSRAGDYGPQKDFGSFWSADAPTSVLQARYDKAIFPEWYNKNGEITAYSPLSMGYTASFPEGTTMYTGTVRRQIGLDGTIYPGGTPQVLIPQSYKHGTIIDKWELELK